MNTRSRNKSDGAGLKSKGRGTASATPPADAVRAAQDAIRKEPTLPENYTVLAGALRTLAQSLREGNREGSDHLLHLACAAAWEAKSKFGPELVSGRTKQEIKILIAWLRTKNHIGPEASESLMDEIHSKHLSEALDESVLSNGG